MKKRGTSFRERTRVIAAAAKYTFLQNIFDGFILFTILVQPLLVAALALWMLRGKGEDFAIYVVIGSGMSGLWSSLLFISGGSIDNERWFGTLEALTGAPASMRDIVFGKNLAQVTQSLISMIGTYILAAIVFGYSMTIEMPLLFIASLLLTVISLIAFGLIIAPAFVLNPEVRRWQNGIEFPVYILSGFLFPILMIPVWTRPVSWILPTYWAAKALHASAEGTEPVRSILFSWLILTLLSSVYFLLSARLFTLVIRKAKAEGTLESR